MQLRLAVLLSLCLVPALAGANTINQNASWKITRSDSSQTYRVVAYGDSIFAGYYGTLFRVAKRSAPHAGGEYLSTQWGTNVEVVRRTKSGARASDIYNNKIVNERSYMQHASTRVVMFEMCGNDYLQARAAFAEQTGTCNYAGLESALASCTTYMERSMQAINQYATSAKLKVIANIYYPGYDADDALSNCTDSATGQRLNRQDKFLPLLARSNHRACRLAETYGFACADSFADYMGADYDSNGDGLVDSEALRYRSGESENDYVTRISTTLRSTIRDANTHFTNASTSFDYIQSDNVHPTYYSSATVGLGLFNNSGSGSGGAEYKDAQIVDGKNPQWNRYGHERMGWLMSLFGPATP